MDVKTYSEKERRCNASFLSAGPYWHAYTSGKETPLLFSCTQDFAFAMNVVAQASNVFKGVTILAFEILNNHFHFVLSAEESEILEFWNYCRRRIGRFFPSAKGIDLSLRQIEVLSSLRNCIIYTNRNGYVADPSYTPFSYPWGTGRCYFLDAPSGVKFSEMKFDDRRRILRSRFPGLPNDWVIVNDYVSPFSYCAVKLGMAMFRDAHHYFAMLSKGVESYSEFAAELDDGEFLTDAELFTQIMKCLKQSYGVTALHDLTRPQKLDLAKKLHYDFRSSNGQIRRVLALSQYDVDALFPLSS